MGGHQPKKIAGDRCALLLQRCQAAEDITLRGLGAELGKRGLAAVD
jgi:hypothetical protein